MKMLFGFLILGLLLTVTILPDAFAENTYSVKIPTGAASPDAPYFWQSEKDGATNGIVEILVGDTIKWQNADTAAHTVTSGSATDGSNDIFDSGLFPPGQTFSYTFEEIGTYPYFCIVHPWMEGSIIVTAGYSVIPDVGKQVGDGKTLFDVEYKFNRLLTISAINVDQKSLMFSVVGNPKSDNHNLEIKLDSELIDGPFVVWLDGNKISDFSSVKDGNYNILSIPLSADSKTLTIVGTTIVPEFGSLVMMILSISIISIIAISKKFGMRVKF
ncbi:MAG: PEFG-CTERM sorting domain-containing protein [Nitrosopumilus sp.]|uniref:cupredoxin domain-containing protein n=1 Tax=Nitrosopumilus sp. TaxID=2024843 RepID=UPI00247E8A15|nr:PEFG-CTERM sorting domain-containing protein [Nitrosopumilus sp.]MCV0392137.1 PEFG-CTERM sorting domain-containing protein [Nitrosopumilus sp.]